MTALSLRSPGSSLGTDIRFNVRQSIPLRQTPQSAAESSTPGGSTEVQYYVPRTPRDFTSLNSFLFGPSDLWAVCLHTENPAYYTLTLAETEHGPIISSEPLPELGGNQTQIPNRTIFHINRRSGAIENHALG